MEAYNKKLTEDQKLAMKDERIRLKELDEKRAKKLELKERQKKYGKPKMPLSAFLLFHMEESKKSKTNVLSTKAKYDALSETQKSQYIQKAAASRVEYKWVKCIRIMNLSLFSKLVETGTVIWHMKNI